MDAKHISDIITRAKDDILREVTDRLPRAVGITAVNHFTQNFRDSGFRDGGLRPWQKTLRQRGKGTDAQYGPLTSRRNHLMRSTSFTAAPGQVTIENPVPYAAIHNEGGVIRIPNKPRTPKKTKNLSLRQVRAVRAVREVPSVRVVRIPKRQFIGNSKELTQKINRLINESIERIKNGISALTSH